MDTSTKKLLGGSMIYFVGNALTQLISLLLMRFVTGNVTPEEYGFFNLVTTISNLVIPFVTVQMSEAVFKFVLKANAEDEKKSYFSICFVVSAISIALIFLGVAILSNFVSIPKAPLVALYVASYALFGIYQKILRCLNRNKDFVVGNLIKTIFFLSLEILLILVLDSGIEALLLAHSFSIAFFLIYAELRARALRYFDLRAIKLRPLSEMLKFSIPLVPNAAFWWMTSSINSVIVSAKLGMDINGIYSVSAKFSAVLNMVTNVLNMAWQDTAIADYGSENFSKFLTDTFNSFVKLIFSAIAVLVPLIALVLPHMIDPSYYAAIPYAPFLLLASGTSFMSGFMAQIFVGRGETKKILTTSILGMACNIIVIAVLVEKVGLWAAVLGSLSADVVLFGTRTFFARREFAKGIHYKRFFIVLVMMIVSVVLYLKAGVALNMAWLVLSAIVAVILNWQFIQNILHILFGRFFENREKRA